ncbi:MAG: M16 family metallopeptidase [Candidatus Cryptobacteroides sp.]
MKRILIYAAFVIAAISAASCSQYKYETVAGDPLGTKIYTLDNGLKVYMSVNKETPRIQTYIAVRVGGKNDPSETTGLAHYFEHLMFKGTESFGTSDYTAEKPMLDEIESLFEVYRKTTDPKERECIYHRIDSISYEASKIAIPNEYDKLMSIIGAEGTNAFTSQDMTVYVEDIPSNQIENWARIEADRFMHPVLRGFHTELETIYEEKNMSLTQDSRKVWEAMDAALFPNHPYGTQTVLGTQEHLKNPSITNVKNYHKTWYVPNNMAICLSGDFDPDNMVAIIKKYFGAMQPNPELPKLDFKPEEPITTPIVREVYGLEAENVMLGWRLPAANDKSYDAAMIASNILYNGQAGLIDLDINQQQKALIAYSSASPQPDYGQFIVAGRPKQGQSLDELKDLLLGEVAKLRNGDFDESLVASTINNFKLEVMQQLEDNGSRAMLYVDSFINGSDWADEVKQLDRMSEITKEDIVAWANKYLAPESYAIVYKKMGQDKEQQKIAAPKITPIVTNRDNQSAFLCEIQASEVKPIEPVFVDYERDMERFSCSGMETLYKKKDINDIANLYLVYNTGRENDPAIGCALDYISYLGTATMSAEEIASRMYSLACSFRFMAGTNQSSILVSGLSENIPEALGIVEDLICNAQPDEAILANMKEDLKKSRADSKLNQRACFSALQKYVLIGPEFIKRTTLSDKEIDALTSEQLLKKVADLFTKQHEILYYGPESAKSLKTTLEASHKVADNPEPLERTFPQLRTVDAPEVVIAPYDAKQLYYIQYSNRGEKYSPADDAAITLYNAYFGGGMNTIVFQEMREARGLAYSASARLSEPQFKDDSYYYFAFIATQNDKMQQAIEAFDEIINDMPESEAAFDIAKESKISSMRTDRVTGDAVLWSYMDDRDMGLSENRSKRIFSEIQDITLEDVKATQEKWVKGRHYTYAILGDRKDIDLTYLKTLGTVKFLSLEDIFGY